jgi:hypothetical protein
MSKKPVQQGIFIGRGLYKDAPASFMNWGRIWIDQDNNPVDLDSLPNDFDRSTLKEGSPALFVGKANPMPVWDEEVLRAAIASENFAHPRMEEQINGWLDQGIESHALYEKVKEAKGLLTLKDVGLEPVEVAPVEEKQG